jgi:PleD family two-component response regulator
MHLRVLIVESDPEDLLFLDDVLIEIEEGRHWIPWLEVETHGASSCAEAVTVLSREAIDVILLNPDLSDSQGALAFRKLYAVAGPIPIILLVEATDQDLALQLVREGAQDFLVKKQADCALLAHAIRSAMERHRLLTATRFATMTDPLTGLLNRGAFFSLAERDRGLAERLGRRLLLIIAEAGNDAGDLTLIEVSDVLRGLAGPTGLLARLGESRFALALLDTDEEPVESAWAQIHSSAAGRHIAIGAAIFEPREPVTLEVLLERAGMDLRPAALTAIAATVRR